MKIIVTGGAGFIGSNFVRLALEEQWADRIVNVDALTYAGNLGNLEDVRQDPRYRFVRADVCDGPALVDVLREEKPSAVVHFAAESHVDRSIMEPGAFLRTNVLGTATLLDASREAGIERVVIVSTDEVYGSLGEVGKFKEDTPLDPSSPYSASKAAADLLALAYHRTFGVDVIVTRCSNNYGRFQFPEKLIPLMIIRALENGRLPVYGDGRNVRDWIHVDDHCRGVKLALERGRPGQVYNLGGEAERENVQVVRHILRRLNRSDSLIQFVTDRPGHDRRYAMDIQRARAELGFAPRVTFEEGLDATIDWYAKNQDWWRRVLDGSYRTYFERNYGARGVA